MVRGERRWGLLIICTAIEEAYEAAELDYSAAVMLVCRLIVNIPARTAHVPKGYKR
jgi:hypothetical protein